jgi:hypothetical protein
MTPSSTNPADPSDVPPGWALTLHKVDAPPPTTTGEVNYVDGEVLYHIWASASGTDLNHPTWASLSKEDQQRWGFFALHHPIPTHDNAMANPPDPKDVQKYPSLTRVKEQINFADYDEMVHPTPSLNYSQWTILAIQAARKHPWQFWKPRLHDIDTSEHAYRLWCAAELVSM